MTEIDLEYWMTNLPEAAREQCIHHLAIPGSHNSGTSTLTRISRNAPDLKNTVKLPWCVPAALVLLDWCKCQNVSITTQLKYGIRYLDLRVCCTSPNEEEFFICHGLLGGNVATLLSDINTFCCSHPDEIVIVHFMHFYGITAKGHRNLVCLILNTFGVRLVHKSKTQSRIKEMCAEGTNVIVIYAKETNEKVLWNRWHIENPWHDEKDIPILLHKIESSLDNRATGTLHVCQAILTVDFKFILTHPLSLYRSCAKPLEERLYTKWIGGKFAGEPDAGAINIVVYDFVELKNYRLAKSIIDLNYQGKFLKDVDQQVELSSDITSFGRIAEENK